MALKASSLTGTVCCNKNHVWCIAHPFKVGPGRGSRRWSSVSQAVCHDLGVGERVGMALLPF